MSLWYTIFESEGNKDEEKQRTRRDLCGIPSFGNDTEEEEQEARTQEE